jgi:hypothetical protein
LGEELSFEPIVLRFGYSYRPSILASIPVNAGNYVDPSKHIVDLGFGWNFRHFLGYDIPTHLDFNLSLQHLITQHIEKTAGDETGAAGDSKIGSPEYNAGGNIYGGGVSLSMEL